MLLIIGGGLAGGLLSLALKRVGFENFLLVEAGEKFGGNHTWSFHRQDVPDLLWEVLSPKLKGSWPAHDILMPKYERRLESSYHSLRSEDFHDLLLTELSQRQYRLGEKANPADFPLVIDTRPLPIESYGPVAYQNFVGLDLYFPDGHGLELPRLMDTRVDQKNAYRFIYSLPWDKHRILVEDTRYENTPLGESMSWDEEVKSYARKEYGGNFRVERREAAALPLPLTKQMFSTEPDEKTFPFGMRAGFFNPTTGYSFPQAAQFSVELARAISADNLSSSYRRLRAQWQKDCAYYFVLNRMLFGAAQGEERLRIFERFYKLSDDLIHRFYQGNLKLRDQARILVGKPPVSVKRAVQSLLNSQWMDEKRL